MATSSETLFQGWLEEKMGGKWRPFWVVLKANTREKTLYFYENEDTRSQNANQIGRLLIDRDTKVNIGKGDKTTGYRFNVITNRFTNEFRCKKFTERELWSAYITGLATGMVPRDIDLHQDQLQRIISQLSSLESFSPAASQATVAQRRSALSEQRVSVTEIGSRGSGGSHRDSNQSRGSSESEADVRSRGSGGRSVNCDAVSRVSYSGSGGKPNIVRSSSHSDGPDITFIHNANNGGPFVRHKFYKDPTNMMTPSWFFEKGDRNVAIEILEKGSAYGNTLMRLSSKHRDDGSYVISKRNHAFNFEIEHYEVIRVMEGYKLNVDNQHDPMKCLQDVMDFFVQASGPHDTHPMTCNSLQMLGLRESDYSPYAHEIKAKVIEPDTGENSKKDMNAQKKFETDQNYLEPVELRNKPVSQKERSGHITWTESNRNQQSASFASPVQYASTAALPQQAPAAPDLGSLEKLVKKQNRSTIAVVNPSLKKKINVTDLHQHFQEEDATRKLEEIISSYDNAGGKAPANIPAAPPMTSSIPPAPSLFNSAPPPPAIPQNISTPTSPGLPTVKPENPYNERPLPQTPGESLAPVSETGFLAELRSGKTGLRNELQSGDQVYPPNFNPRSRRSTEPAIVMERELPPSGSKVSVVNESFKKRLNIMIQPKTDPKPLRPLRRTISPGDNAYVDAASAKGVHTASSFDEEHNYEELPLRDNISRPP